MLNLSKFVIGENLFFRLMEIKGFFLIDIWIVVLKFMFFSY